MKYTKEDIKTISEAVEIYDNIPVENIQDQIEQLLMSNNFPVVAKEYILYRKRKTTIREWVKKKEDLYNRFDIEAIAQMKKESEKNYQFCKQICEQYA